MGKKDYYKAVPKKFLLAGGDWKGIRVTGLDPKRCGCAGGATSLSRSIRQPTELDKDVTWLAKYEKALTYAESSFANHEPVILKVEVEEDWAKEHMNEKTDATAWTKALILPLYIFFDSGEAKNNAKKEKYQRVWLPIKDYSGKNAYVHKF